jgi:hypothetical protein
MKKFLLPLFAMLICSVGFSQSEKYVKAMEQLVPAVDTTRNPDNLTELSNSFERIANAEKTQWLPYYYAALCLINKANGYYTSQQNDLIDPVMEKAEPLLNKAKELEANNSEIYCAIKMLNTGKMMADPMNRYMTYGPAATEALEMAKKLNPENPRVYLLEGIDKFYTPEQFGGSKEEGHKLFLTAKEKFGTFKPKSTIDPNWGLPQVNYFLAQ